MLTFTVTWLFNRAQINQLSLGLHMQSTNHDQLVAIVTKQGNVKIYFCLTVFWYWLCRSSWIMVTMTHLIPPCIHSSRRKLPCHFVAILFQNKSWSFLRVSGGLCKCCSNLFVFNESFWIRAWSHARFRWGPHCLFSIANKGAIVWKLLKSMLLFNHTPALNCWAPSGFRLVFVMWEFIFNHCFHRLCFLWRSFQ